MNYNEHLFTDSLVDAGWNVRISKSSFDLDAVLSDGTKLSKTISRPVSKKHIFVVPTVSNEKAMKETLELFSGISNALDKFFV